MNEVEIDAFAEAARAELERGLAAHAPVRDLADVAVRANEIDPAIVSDALVREAGTFAPVLGLGAPAPISAADARRLELVNDDTRVLLDEALEERRMAAIPSPGRRRRRRPVWTWAAAAGVLLFAGGALAAVVKLVAPGPEATPSAAEYVAEPASSGGSGVAGSDRAAPDQTAVPELETSPPAPDIVPAQSEPVAVDEPAPPPSKRDPEALAARLAELDARAQAAWKNGDLRGAEKIFEKIVRLGGRTQYAEQAYGELFSLSRQLGGADEQARLWRAYLRRFPRGRYADDARAGLCRRAEGDAKTKCWNRYLDKHPKGAHRGEARRETSG